jgi:hypothetical protein
MWSDIISNFKLINFPVHVELFNDNKHGSGEKTMNIISNKFKVTEVFISIYVYYTEYPTV